MQNSDGRDEYLRDNNIALWMIAFICSHTFMPNEILQYICGVKVIIECVAGIFSVVIKWRTR